MDSPIAFNKLSKASLCSGFAERELIFFEKVFCVDSSNFIFLAKLFINDLKEALIKLYCFWISFFFARNNFLFPIFNFIECN